MTRVGAGRVLISVVEHVDISVDDVPTDGRLIVVGYDIARHLLRLSIQTRILKRGQERLSNNGCSREEAGRQRKLNHTYDDRDARQARP